MIDTIVLILSPSQYQLTQPDRFSSSYRPIGTARGLAMWHQNASREDTLNGRYMPRLTLTQRPSASGTIRHLTIELSVPKLLFGNNFDELTDEDIPKVMEILHLRLMTMGVTTNLETLLNCQPKAIHYSKNVVFEDGTTSRLLIDLIRKANGTRRRETNLREYCDGGYAFRWHTNSYEIIYYDKVHDLQKAKRSEKGRFEKDNWIQMSLLDSFEQVEKPFEVLRMEVRLNTKRKIKETMSKINIGGQLSLGELAHTDVAKAVLMLFWNEMRASLPPMTDEQSRLASALRSMVMQSKVEPLRRHLFVVGLQRLINEEGMSGARELVCELSGDRNWYRMLKTLKESPLQITQSYKALDIAGQIIQTGAPSKLADHVCLVNNS